VALTLTPRPVIAIAWILFCGMYGIWASIEQRQWILGALGFGFLLAGLGVVLRWRWSQWLVYALSTLWIGSWLYGIYLAIRAGVFPSEGLEITMLQLVPGLAIVAAMVWSADTVRRRFARPIEQA
jgi:hypothetical protein